MQIKTGGYYTIKNEKTRQQAQCQVHEIHRYQGQLLIAGSLCAHTVHVPQTLGVVTVTDRPFAFPTFPSDDARLVQDFMKALNSGPLQIYLDHETYIPVPNAHWEASIEESNSLSFWTGKAAALVRGWYYWRIMGRLPEDLRRQIDAPLTPLTRNFN